MDQLFLSEQFLHSIDSILPTVNIFQNLKGSSQTLLFCQLSLCNILSPLNVVILTVLLTSSPGVDSWNCFSVLIHKKQLPHPLMTSQDCSSSGSIPNLVFWLFTTSVVISFSEILNDSESSMRVGICFFQSPLGDIDLSPWIMNALSGI